MEKQDSFLYDNALNLFIHFSECAKVQKLKKKKKKIFLNRTRGFNYICLLSLILAVILPDDPVVQRSICRSRRHKRLKLNGF